MPDKATRKPRTRTRKTAPLAARGGEVAKVDQYIADQLKAMYDAVTVEPVPDHLLQLIERLGDNPEE